MPIYDYVCSTCGVKEENVLAKASETTKVCEACGAEAKRQMPRPGRILFQHNGYKSDVAD